MLSIRKITALSIGLLIFAASAAAQTKVWTENSFEDFIDGTFLDAGSNLYVSAAGRLQMIARWDFNNDGNPDILLSAGHPHSEKENTFIYYNTGGEISGRNRDEIPGGGSRDGVLVDFNKDGWLDMAVANFHDSHFFDMDAWIYYGGPEGFPVAQRTMVPAHEATSIAAGDFNGDGWPDIALGCQWLPENAAAGEPKMSFIYWNSEEGFSRDRRAGFTFEGKGADYVAAGDLDADGIDDLIASVSGKTHIFYSSRGAISEPAKGVTLPAGSGALAVGNINNDAYPEIAVCTTGAVMVLMGGPDGYTLENQIKLPVDTPMDAVFADIDGDGFDDVAAANQALPGGASWADSYVFYSKNGSLSADDPLKLPTLGATGVSAGDLNGDGLPELVFSNQYVINQNEIASYVFWNKDGRFMPEQRTQLLTQGSWANSIGDINRDGMPDVIFYNDQGYIADGPTTSNIYWGDGTRHFSRDRYTSFHTFQGFGQGHADLDDNGIVDLIFSRGSFIAHVPHQQQGLILYWGGTGTYGGPQYLTMTTAYGGVRVADINRDGWLDILAGGAVEDPDDPSKHGFPIYWGSAEGFKNTNRTLLHIEIIKIRGPLLMDLNRDGWLDIAGQEKNGQVKIWWGTAAGFSDSGFSILDLGREDDLEYLKAADFNKDGWLDLFCPYRAPPEAADVTSFFYYGSKNGFSNERRIEIPTYVPYQNTFADFDRDGWLDMFICSYGGEVSGNRPSLIYWGGPDGFFKRPRLELETYGTSGSKAVDYDGDGWLDLLIANHRKSVNWNVAQPHRHTCNSMLYWGGPEGFTEKNRWEVEAEGPFGLSLRDLGNSYDRGLYEDYVSSVYHISKPEKPARIEWEAETPYGTAVRFQLRTAGSRERLKSTVWTGPDGPESWYEKSGSKIQPEKGKFIQYRARLETPNGAATPYLTAVTIQFN